MDKLQSVRSLNYTASTVGAEAGSNLVTVDGHYACGFRTTDFDEVLPQLRPNLTIPGVQGKPVEYFRNATRLRMVLDRIGDAAAYVWFLYRVESLSGVTEPMAQNFQSFAESFREDAGQLLSASLLAGVDISEPILAKFIIDNFGATGVVDPESTLYRKMGSTDPFKFIRNTLLAPSSAKLWSEASGGLLPLTFRNNTNAPGLTLFDVAGVGYNAGKPFLKTNLTVPFNNPDKALLDLYTRKGLAPQTPWYPVFRYNRASAPVLVFVQFAGPNMIVYGRKYVVMPVNAARPDDSVISPDFANLNPIDTTATLSEAMLARISDPENSFDGECNIPGSTLTKNQPYSAYFPNTTFDQPLRDRSRVIVLGMANACFRNKAETALTADNGFQAVDWLAGYTAFNVESIASNPVESSAPFLVDQKLAAVNICPQNTGACTAGSGASRIVLLPINSASAGPSFENAFRWGDNRKLVDLVKPGDYTDYDTVRYMQ
jgi:hypothetical protein